MELNKDTICQSCGMPMLAVEHFGTEANNDKSEDYCCFCFKEGKLTDNLSFNNFVSDIIQYHDESEKVNGCTITKSEAELYSRIKLPNLKRWAFHKITHQEYYKSVNRVVEYIDKHLSEEINLNKLSQIAQISEYHFHRIFKAVINESLGAYIQRLRLEKASFKLLTTKSSLTDISEQVGYQSSHALSKAFKKKFAINPSDFRKKPIDLVSPLNKPIDNLFVNPEIKEIEQKNVISVQISNPFYNINAFQKAWKSLIKYAKTSGIPDEDHEYICVSKDISTVTKPEFCRMYVCINTSEKLTANFKFGQQTIEGGIYAIFTHKGAYKNLETLYCNIYRYWIPNSDYELRDTFQFEKFLNSPSEVSEVNLLTEIYIPICHIQ